MRYCKPVLIGTAVGAIVITVILMLLSLVLSLQDIPQMLITPMVLVALAAGSLMAGLFSARLVREKGLVLGLCCGIILFALLWLCGFQVNAEGIGPMAAVKLAVALVFSALGGIMGVNLKKRRK